MIHIVGAAVTRQRADVRADQAWVVTAAVLQDVCLTDTRPAMREQIGFLRMCLKIGMSDLPCVNSQIAVAPSCEGAGEVDLPVPARFQRSLVPSYTSLHPKATDRAEAVFQPFPDVKSPTLDQVTVNLPAAPFW
jgi:hypothetical protein